VKLHLLVNLEILRAALMKYVQTSELAFPILHATLNAYLFFSLLFLLLPLEHVASMKLLVSLQFLNLRQSIRLLRRGIS
jgi:hypothetical protein